MYKIIIAVLIVLVPSFAFSEPCTQLAVSFAKNSDSMDVNELAALRSCISKKIREKLNNERMVAPAPAPPMHRPAPEMEPNISPKDMPNPKSE
jgi:hypothetical protein